MSEVDREYCVVYRHPKEGLHFAGPGFGASWTTDYEYVKQHYEYLTGEHRDAVRTTAEENEASDFEGGNEAWYRWNNSRTGFKDRRYAILSRPTPEPSTVEEAEEGFSVTAD